MKKILCPTDFSKAADNGVSYAAKLCQKTGAHLDLFHALSLANRTPEEALLGAKMNEQMAYDRLEYFSREISKVFRISCNAHVATSVTALTSVIEQEAAGHDLIVMGTHGRGNLLESVFGSHSYHIAKKASLPVLVVPEGCGYSDIRKTAFAFDYWRENTFPLQQLIHVLKPLDSSLTILEVLEESYSLRAEEEIKADQQVIRDSFEGHLKLDFDTLHTAHISQALDHYVKEKQIDLLALCSQHQSFFQRLFHKSLIKELTQIATYPLLVIHNPD